MGELENAVIDLSRGRKGIYCTIVAQNYLGQALALYSSVREQEPDRDLVILVVDADRGELAHSRSHLRILGLKDLGLDAQEIDRLAMIYDVVELSTAVKPLLLKLLLDTHEQAVYLDPDMFVIGALTELEGAIEEYGIVLTPHFLSPIPAGVTHITEVHSLTVGVHNLGFCAVGRAGIPFLDWWWGHLKRECLIYPLLGLFVDQKWTDVGANLFGAHSLRHHGYNVGPWNLHERLFEMQGSDLMIPASGEPLRLMHFSGFDPRDPGAISERLNLDMRNLALDTPALRDISEIYAQRVLDAEKILGPKPQYGYVKDSSGRVISKRMRRAYRKALIDGDTNLPSPFRAADASEFRSWKLSASKKMIGISAGDSALAFKYALPDEFGRLKSTLPKQFRWLRTRLLSATKVRR